jgi:hypothetical protein
MLKLDRRYLLYRDTKQKSWVSISTPTVISCWQVHSITRPKYGMYALVYAFSHWKVTQENSRVVSLILPATIAWQVQSIALANYGMWAQVNALKLSAAILTKFSMLASIVLVTNWQRLVQTDSLEFTMCFPEHASQFYKDTRMKSVKSSSTPRATKLSLPRATKLAKFGQQTRVTRFKRWTATMMRSFPALSTTRATL